MIHRKKLLAEFRQFSVYKLTMLSYGFLSLIIDCFLLNDSACSSFCKYRLNIKYSIFLFPSEYIPLNQDCSVYILSFKHAIHFDAEVF